jgi:hypothetical protein
MQNPSYHGLVLTPELKRQFRHEIVWLKTQCLHVEEKMKRKPSKVCHLNDLKRQIADIENFLKKN